MNLVERLEKNKTARLNAIETARKKKQKAEEREYTKIAKQLFLEAKKTFARKLIKASKEGQESTSVCDAPNWQVCDRVANLFNELFKTNKKYQGLAAYNDRIDGDVDNPTWWFVTVKWKQIKDCQ